MNEKKSDPAVIEFHTRVNHERDPHCCGCWSITDEGPEKLAAVCNECGERRDLVRLLCQGYSP